MYYGNSTEFYISLALFILFFIGGYLIDHNHEKAGSRIVIPLILFMGASVALSTIAFFYLLFRAIFMQKKETTHRTNIFITMLIATAHPFRIACLHTDIKKTVKKGFNIFHCFHSQIQKVQAQRFQQVQEVMVSSLKEKRLSTFCASLRSYKMCSLYTALRR